MAAEIHVVTLESELEGHDGHCSVAWPRLEPEERARRSALVALAGPLAEMAYRGDSPEDFGELSSFRADLAEAERCIQQLPAEERAEGRRKLFRQVVRALDDVDVWERVARVADALDAHGTLDADQFLDAVGDLPEL